MRLTLTQCLFPILLLISLQNSISAQDTFSIVAVDAETGEVGSAGASCIDDGDCGGCGGVIIISGILPGRGAINAQAQVCLPNINLENGLDQLDFGNSPQEVIDWLMANDACQFGNITNRQYGVVDFDPEGNPRSAAFTGVNDLDWKGHLTGDNYSIQGNILLGPQILDSMEARFLNAEGSLAERLMAALQGANVAGADSRCLTEGVSSKSAYLRVAKPDDPVGEIFLELNVPATPFGKEPIDSLQSLFDEWLGTIVSTSEVYENKKIAKIYPNPTKNSLTVELISKKGGIPNFTAKLFDTSGKELLRQPLLTEKTNLNVGQFPYAGLLLLKIENERGKVLFSEKVIVISD